MNAFLHLPNQRFTFDPAANRLHLTAHRIGGPSIDVGSFERDYSIGTNGEGRNLENCIIGYVSGEAEGFRHGLIHFCGLRGPFVNHRASVRQAIAHFVSMGASRNTILRGFGNDHRAESPLGKSCPDLVV